MMRLLALVAACAVLAAGQSREEAMSHYVDRPGGTLEKDLWQVLVLFGVGQSGEKPWQGGLSIQQGDIFRVEGYRFEPPDAILPAGGWRLIVKPERMETGTIIDAEGGSAVEIVVMPKGLLVQGRGGPATTLTVDAGADGKFSVQPNRLRFGAWTPQLGGRASVQRIPPATDLSGAEMRQHDFPSVAAAADGALSAVWMSYHDRREELNFRRRLPSGEWTRLLAVPRSDEDVWRPQVEHDGDGVPWLIWSHRPTSDGPGNWDLFAMPWENNRWGARVRLTDNPLPDIEPSVARAPDGTIYVAWQALRGRSSQVHLRYLRGGKWSEPLAVTNTPENNWAPAVAAGPDGAAWIAWDRYDGDYNVYLRRFSPDAGFGPERQVIGTPRFEAHVSVAVDPRNRPWVAWETDAVNWGKDYGFYLGDRSPGAPLAGNRETEIAVLDGETWKAAPPVRFSDPLEAGNSAHSAPMLWFDPDRRWLSFKRRIARRGIFAGVYWEYYLSRLEGDRWGDPILLGPSGNRKSTRLSLTASDGRLWAFWPHDNRDWAFGSRPHNARVATGSLELPGPAAEPKLTPFEPPAITVAPADPNEAENVRFIRDDRIEYQGRSLRILRGDLHRHTELSPDQGGLPDGSLPEFYRYMIDAAAMDFGASTDHQAGGADFWNFMTQKMADMYHFPDRFSTLYAYERNVGNPHGHRNMLYTKRDYPIVPFFQRLDERFLLPDTPDGELLTFNSNSFGGNVDNDTDLLLEAVRKSGGIAIPHTSGSVGMGTDWHAFDPEVDAVVEIYQGDRISNEHEGAPRWQRADGKQAGGWQQPGAVWNAWKKGYKIGVIASSDHMSTHISYAMILAPSTSRQDVWQAIKDRHAYGATDNITLEYRLGECLMGDDCGKIAPTPFRVRVRGTGDIAAIHLIRDGEYIYKAEPGAQTAQFEFLDRGAGPGEHWYYVRVEQANEEIAWSSPIWVEWK